MNLTHLGDVAVIIPAAGRGQRMGSQGNKLLLELAGIPLLLFALKTFNECSYIKEIIIPAAENDVPEIKKIASEFAINKVTSIVQGGKERQDSVFNALQVLNPHIKRVVIHDGARPLLTLKELNCFLEQTINFEAAVMAVQPKDTIKKVDKDNWVLGTLVRDGLRAIQTPQIFDRLLLEKVHKTAYECQYYATDDSALLEWQGYQVKVLAGSYENIKVTTPEDLLLAENIMRRRQKLTADILRDVK